MSSVLYAAGVLAIDGTDVILEFQADGELDGCIEVVGFNVILGAEVEG